MIYILFTIFAILSCSYVHHTKSLPENYRDGYYIVVFVLSLLLLVVGLVTVRL